MVALAEIKVRKGDTGCVVTTLSISRKNLTNTTPSAMADFLIPSLAMIKITAPRSGSSLNSLIAESVRASRGTTLHQTSNQCPAANSF